MYKCFALLPGGSQIFIFLITNCSQSIPFAAFNTSFNLVLCKSPICRVYFTIQQNEKSIHNIVLDLFKLFRLSPHIKLLRLKPLIPHNFTKRPRIRGFKIRPPEFHFAEQQTRHHLFNCSLCEKISRSMRISGFLLTLHIIYATIYLETFLNRL